MPTRFFMCESPLFYEMMHRFFPFRIPPEENLVNALGQAGPANKQGADGIYFLQKCGQALRRRKNMDTGCRKWQIGGFLFTSAVGALLHFTYEWSGKNPVVGAFSAVNESTWEHMKLLFVPLLLVALAAAIFGGHCRGYWTAKLAGALVGLLLIPMLYYGYTETLGVHVTWVDIGIFFVAAARSLGIPAWEDAVTGNICYRQDGKEKVVNFEAAVSANPEESLLKATYKAIPRLKDPKYYTHFSLSKFDNGTFRLQNYPEDATWSSLLKKGTEVETGYYMLVSGSRMADGTVLSEVSFINVEKGKPAATELKMRDSQENIRVIGNFNSESQFYLPGKAEPTTILSTTGRGYFIVGILGVGQEPTNHALKDIAIKKDDIEKWGRTIVLLFPDETSYKKFNLKEFPNLPSNIVFGIDKDGSIQQSIAENLKLPNAHQLPIFIIADTFNRVVFESHGYTIGMGEQLLQVIHGL